MSALNPIGFSASLRAIDHLPQSTPMLDIPTKYAYEFPLTDIELKYRETGGYVKAKIVQLTRWRAYWNIDRLWWKFRGPFRTPCPVPEDRLWKWGTYVRRLRKNPWARCAAAQTEDMRYQGAIVYRRDGASTLQAGMGAVYGEYLASAPHNRPEYAAKPLYSGVGRALMYLAILDSYRWGLGGRVALYSLPSALAFYIKMKFVTTGQREGRMIHCELTSESAVDLMRDKGLL